MAKAYNKKQALKLTEQRKRMWLIRMMRLASSAIRWEGLDENIDKVYLELCLTRTGSAIIMYDDLTDTYWCGQNASVGMLDNYAYPEQRSIIMRNGKQFWCTPENSVIIYNNSLRCGDLWMYEIIADDLCDMDLAMRVNINTQKTMPIIPTKETQVLSGENIMQNLIENVPYQFVDPQAMDIEAFKTALTFDNRQSFTADNILKIQREFWNRALTIIGINNNNVEKKERLNIAEADSNLDEIAIMRRDRLNAREEAVKMMNQLWGWDVTVDYYSNLKIEEGGNGNGGIYDASQDDMRERLSDFA